MAGSRDALKKQVQEYEMAHLLQGWWQIALVTISLVSAICAAVCAFTEVHDWDKKFSAVVLAFLVLEAITVGFGHWKKASTDANRCRKVAESLTDENVEAQLADVTDLAPGDYALPIQTVAVSLNSLRWKGYSKLPLVLATSAVAVAMILWALLAWWAAGQLIAHTSARGVEQTLATPKAGEVRLYHNLRDSMAATYVIPWPRIESPTDPIATNPARNSTDATTKAG